MYSNYGLARMSSLSRISVYRTKNGSHLDYAYMRLAQAVVLAAVKDARVGSESALDWLIDEDASGLWFTVGNIRRSVVLRWCERIKKRGRVKK